MVLARTAGSYESVAAELTGPMCLGGGGDEDDAFEKSGTVGRVEASSSAINVDDDTAAAMEEREKAEKKKAKERATIEKCACFKEGVMGVCRLWAGREGGAWLLS